MKLRKYQQIVGVCLLLMIQSAFAGNGIKMLKEFHKNVKSFEAEFKQKVIDEKKVELQAASGQMYLLRPGKFRWDYKEPDEQVIVSNGEKIWLYDQELEQVTIKSLKGMVGNTPARILSDSGSLEKDFNITEQGEKEGITWVELTPKEENSQFKSVRIGFTDTLKIMEIRDSLGQTTFIEFSKLKKNPTLKVSLFEFKIPKGVDIVKDPTAKLQSKVKP